MSCAISCFFFPPTPHFRSTPNPHQNCSFYPHRADLLQMAMVLKLDGSSNHFTSFYPLHWRPMEESFFVIFHTQWSSPHRGHRCQPSADPPRHCRGTMEFNPAVASCMGMSKFWRLMRLSRRLVCSGDIYITWVSLQKNNDVHKILIVRMTFLGWGNGSELRFAEPWWNQWKSAPVPLWNHGKQKYGSQLNVRHRKKKHQKPLEVCWISAGMSRLAFQKSQPFNRF